MLPLNFSTGTKGEVEIYPLMTFKKYLRLSLSYTNKERHHMEVLKVSLNSLSTLMYCGRIGNLNKNLPFFCKEDKKEAIKISLS